MEKKSPQGLSLGTATWQDGYMERRALVARLPGDHGRLVDLNRVERVRQAQLGEGRPDALADALVPPSLRLLLESGPLALQRAAQALRYAEKWRKRGGIPDALAPAACACALLPCLPRPLAVRAGGGRILDRLRVRGPGAALPALSGPTIAIVGGADGEAAGCCIAAESPLGPVLGAWLHAGPLPQGEMALEAGGHRSAAPLDAWADLAPPPLLPGEVFLLPAPKLRLPAPAPGAWVAIETPFDRLEVEYGPEPVHPVIQ
jgi:hypothetical protein